MSTPGAFALSHDKKKYYEMDALVDDRRVRWRDENAAYLARIQDDLRASRDRLQCLPDKRASILERKDLQQHIAQCERQLFQVESGAGERVFEEDVSFCREAQGGRTAGHITRKETFASQTGKETRKKTTSRDIVVRNNLGGLTAINHARTNRAVAELCNDDDSTTLYMCVGNCCEVCGGPLLRMDGQMACEDCGNSVSYIECSSQSLQSEEVNGRGGAQNFSYRRISHLCDWLTCFQAKEKLTIPTEVLVQIMRNLKHVRNLKNASGITPAVIRLVLKEEGLQKYYDNCMLIICLLAGQKPPRLTPHEESLLKTMFLSIQTVWEQHCPETRKNFLSYSYVIYKMMELLGMNQYLKHFSLLKSREKNLRMDAIWRNICSSLDWEYIPSNLE
jgi:uncharacterized Zn finger protein (UPF0148 family)